MNYNNKIVKGAFKRFLIIFLALLFGQITFLFVAISLNSNKVHNFTENSNEIFQIIVPLLSVATIALGNFIFKKRISFLNKEKFFDIKIREYSSSLIIKLALLEGANLFAIVAYLLYADYFFLIIAVIGVLAFLSKVPTKNVMYRDLQIQKNSEEEKLFFA